MIEKLEKVSGGSYRVVGECINCGVCIGHCPNGSITEVNERAVINEDTCFDCGKCAENCPTHAIEQF